MKKRLTISAFLVGALLLVVATGYIMIRYYGYVFAKTVEGEIISVERVSNPEAIIGGGATTLPAQVFSFAVAIKDGQGEIHTASTEDRQWAVVKPGQCAKAKFFPYPPWQFDKSGTYHGARLIRLTDCKPKGSLNNN